jgi:cytochrome P450
MMEARTADPQDDLLSGLVHAEVEDDDGELRRLTSEEIFAFVGLLAGAGTETVARLLSWAAVTLADNPDQRQLLVDDPGLIGNGVEELLRYEAPSPINSRWLTRGVDYYGTTIPANSKVALLNGSADRDERHFADPDRFDVRRDIDRHVALGYGTHYCIGAALARLEAKVALEETLERFPTWEIDKDELVWVHTSTVRGYHHVPLHLP